MDTLIATGRRSVVALQGQMEGLATALRQSNDELADLRTALDSAERSGADESEMADLRVRLQAATVALTRQQLAASLDFPSIEEANRAAVAVVFVELSPGVVSTATAFAAPSSAELFQCTGPDGETIFTDQRGVCPNEKSFEPDAVVHKATDTTKGRAARARHRQWVEERAAESGEQVWKQKKADAQARIDQIQERREKMKPYVSHCNRGGYVTTRDDAGIEEVVNCSKLRHDFAKLDELEQDATNYLTNVLPEECRKAGCLPGWLR